jgi:hypothetical protein
VPPKAPDVIFWDVYVAGCRDPSDFSTQVPNGVGR